MSHTCDGVRQVRVSVVVISKNEPSLADTLERLAKQLAGLAPGLVADAELLVVDASTRPGVADGLASGPARIVPFTAPEGVAVSIPHQRNAGVRAASGDVIVFTDCGCVPDEGWLEALLAPILAGEEQMVAGRTGATGRLDPYHGNRQRQEAIEYLPECPTINLAFTRQVFDDLGGFDETFAYGSDVDFSWRAVHHGVRIRYAPGAVVRHDWGTRRRQLKRSFAYGKARARLYHKHVLGRGEQSIRKRRLDERDAVPLAYPLFLLGLPLTVRLRWYPLLLVVPLWRSRTQRPVATLVDHLVFGAGVLAGARELLGAS